MATILPFTGDEVKKILDGRLHSPTQDVVGITGHSVHLFLWQLIHRIGLGATEL